MFRMYATNSYSYIDLIQAVGIVREPTVWGFRTSQYPGIHDIGLATSDQGTGQLLFSIPLGPKRTPVCRVEETSKVFYRYTDQVFKR